MRLFQPEADIYLNCLKQNYHVIQAIIGDAKVMAVIKANAYGHGIIPVAQTLSSAGIHGFCVSLESEVAELIKADIQTPILHLGQISKDSFELYNSCQVRCTIHSIKDVLELEKVMEIQSTDPSGVERWRLIQRPYEGQGLHSMRLLGQPGSTLLDGGYEPIDGVWGWPLYFSTPLDLFRTERFRGFKPAAKYFDQLYFLTPDNQ